MTEEHKKIAAGYGFDEFMAEVKAKGIGPMQLRNFLIRDLDDKYQELLYAVCTIYPGESRHQTALRYIQEAENRPSHGPAQAANPRPWY